jgi:hypothetical protein
MSEPKVLKGVKHYDFLTLAGDLEITSQGFIKVPIYASRAGVYNYVQKDGSIRRELCPVETLNDPASKQSLQDAPMTNDHRTDIIPDGFLTPETVAKVAVGHVSGYPVLEADKYLKVYGVIQEKGAIEAIRNGKREVSPGYESDVEFTPGMWKDPETQEEFAYDAIQRNRVYNHLAIVDSAREGRDVRIRLDSDDVVVYIENRQQPSQQRSGSMSLLKKYLDDDAPVEKIAVNKGTEVQGHPEKPQAKVKLAEEEYQMDADVARYVHKLHGAFLAEKKKNDDGTKAMDDMKAKMDEMAVELAKHHDDDDDDDDDEDDKKKKDKKMDAMALELKDMKKRLDSAEDPKTFQNKVKARVALLSSALDLVGEKKFKELHLDDATDIEIMKAVLKLDDAKAVLDDKKPEFIEGAFAALKGRVTGAIRNDSNLGRTILEAAAGNTVETAMAEAKTRATDAWKKPTRNGFTRQMASGLTQASQTAGK